MPKDIGYSNSHNKGGMTFKSQPNASKKRDISGKKPNKKLPKLGHK